MKRMLTSLIAVGFIVAAIACGQPGAPSAEPFLDVAPGQLVTALAPGEHGLHDRAGFVGMAVNRDGLVHVLAEEPDTDDSDDDRGFDTGEVHLLALQAGGKVKTLETFLGSKVGYPPFPAKSLAPGPKNRFFYSSGDRKVDIVDPDAPDVSPLAPGEAATDRTKLEAAMAEYSFGQPLSHVVQVGYEEDSDTLWVASRAQVFRIPPDGVARAVAGTGTTQRNTGLGPLLKPDPTAVDYDLGPIGGVALDPRTHDVYIADVSQIWRVKEDKSIAAVAGSLFRGFNGDGGPAKDAMLDTVEGLAFDPLHGDLYLADRINCRVRRIDQNGIISTVAGGGCDAAAKEQGPATSVLLSSPQLLALDGKGNLFITNVFPQRVYMVALPK